MNFDEQRDGQGAQVQSGSEPRFEEGGALLFRNDLGAADAGEESGHGRCLRRLGSGVEVLDRPDLDGDLAQNIALPLA